MGRIDRTLAEILKYEYIVPLYQRSFAWGEDELSKLLQDIYTSYNKDKESNYYVGSLVVIKRDESSEYEVIDGQQRLTAICLIANMLDSNKKDLRLNYDSRHNVRKFLEKYYENNWRHLTEKERESFAKEVEEISKNSIDPNQLRYFEEAINTIENCKLEIQNITNSPSLRELRNEDLSKFADYFFNNVILVLVEMPKNTEVASYFEIMNNRGEQLQKHEILKARLMDTLNSKIGGEQGRADATVFARIWDACSQMDVHIQQSFEAEQRKQIFGEKYDEFHPDRVYEVLLKVQTNAEGVKLSIDDLLNDMEQSGSNKKKDDESNKTSASYAIIDFPNFLMHILKLMYDDNSNSISLDEKHLLSTYDEYKGSIEPMSFVNNLLRYRIFFDRYIVRTSDKGRGNTGEELFKWILEKPTKYESMGFVTSFGGRSIEEAKEVVDYQGDRQERIIKVLSMLQVSFSSRIYKNWLQEVFKWFKKLNTIQELAANDYIRALDKIALDQVEDVINGWKNDREQGTRFSHYLFNFIDYLYWVAKVEGTSKENIKSLEYVPDRFDFRYRSSVEHHYPQSYGNEVKQLDCLANLCLVSNSANSSLSNKEATRKAKDYYSDDLPPKRKIMYETTRNKHKWKNQDIKEHEEELEKLLDSRKEILDSLALDLTNNTAIRALLSLEDISTQDGTVWGQERWTVKNEEEIRKTSAYSNLQSWLRKNQDKTLTQFINEQLANNEELQSAENSWRRMLIIHPEVLEYTTEGCYGWLDGGKQIILIANKVASTHQYREIQAFILYNILNKTDTYKLSNHQDYCFMYLDDYFTPLTSHDEYSNNYLQIWLETETYKWCYQLVTDLHGGTKEIKQLKQDGWVLNQDAKLQTGYKAYYFESKPYLSSKGNKDIEQNIKLAIKEILKILKVLATSFKGNAIA